MGISGKKWAAGRPRLKQVQERFGNFFFTCVLIFAGGTCGNRRFACRHHAITPTCISIALNWNSYCCLISRIGSKLINGNHKSKILTLTPQLERRSNTNGNNLRGELYGHVLYWYNTSTDRILAIILPDISSWFCLRQTTLEVRKAADQRWSRVELGCCGDLSSVPLAFALMVSKEEDRRWFFA
jgi:hypothetical protein